MTNFFIVVDLESHIISSQDTGERDEGDTIKEGLRESPWNTPRLTWMGAVWMVVVSVFKWNRVV